MTKMTYEPWLLNAFSLQMVDAPCSIKVKEIPMPKSFAGFKSAIGHQDTANILGVPMNRVSCKLKIGEIAYVVQLQGGRLPEGSTTLPEGFSFKFYQIEIKK